MQTTIAIVGGTGAEGGGLALRFAQAGARVRIGSRHLEKAQDAARRISAQAHAAEVTGHTNEEAVAEVSIVVLTVPLSAQVETLKAIRGSIAPGASGRRRIRVAANSSMGVKASWKWTQ